MEIDVAAAQTLLQVDDVRRLLEQIFSSLKPAAVVKIMPEDECILAANDSSRLEFGGDAAREVSWVGQTKLFAGGSVGVTRAHPNQPAKASAAIKTTPENFAHDGDSLDDRWKRCVADFSKILQQVAADLYCPGPEKHRREPPVLNCILARH